MGFERYLYWDDAIYGPAMPGCDYHPVLPSVGHLAPGGPASLR